MKRNECAATNGDWCWATGHQVVISRAVIVLIVGNGTNDGEIAEALGEFRHFVAKVNAGDRCGNRSEFSSNFGWCVGFGIERFVVRRPTIEPHHDAAGIFIDAAGWRDGFRLQQIGHAQTAKCSEAGLDKIATSDAVAVSVW